MNITISRLKEIIIEEVNKINEEEGHAGMTCDQAHAGSDHDTYMQLRVLEEEELEESVFSGNGPVAEPAAIEETFSYNTLKDLVKEEYESLLAK